MFLFHAAALPGTRALQGKSVHLSQFAATRLQLQLPQQCGLLQQAFERAFVSSRDGLAAARVWPVLKRLMRVSFAAALHAAGTNLAGSGILGAISQWQGTQASPSSSDSDAEMAEVSDSTAAAAADQPESGLAADSMAAAVSEEARRWLQKVTAGCPAEQAAAIISAAEQLQASGLLPMSSLWEGVLALRNLELKAAGAELQYDVAGAAAALQKSREVRLLGEGDAQRGAGVAAALDAWEAAVRACGAGPIEKLLAGHNNPAEWRRRVELGWPATRAAFETALAAGVPLATMGRRWTGRPGGNWRGRNPSPELVALLAQTRGKRNRSEAEALLL